MAKKTKVNKNYLWILGVVIIIIVLGYYILPRKQVHKVANSSTKSSVVTKNYTSKLLKITIAVPEGYSVEEQFGTITVRKDGSDSKIIVSGIGTNYDNLESFLSDLVDRNHSKLTDKQNLAIDNLQAVKVNINDRRYYLIYHDNWVYSFKTEDTALYSDLDQIAQSFRYTP